MKLRSGLRVVAMFEASKGMLVLLAGFGLLSLIHRNVQHLAETIVSHFHLNPASRYPRIFLELVGNISSGQLWVMASLAFCYANLRLVEAYGLWNDRRWAEWLAMVSGGIYVPIELYELYVGVSWIKLCTLAVNIGILVYMSYVLRTQSNPSEKT